ncbi:hypothetical protein WICMUC_004310 [Wickerhamomyces mucosus]|uniref:Protein NRD1 n=1 Tax=Wickerhamomyces mucosus TaxID=1378264 RepID=A0A9P8PHH2_9ASCO|nr:hypothetical protein WICMUC_004310 [Wickerhamomyces mucosus]
MSSIELFVGILEEIKKIKNGISGSRIKKLTQIAVEDVSNSSEFVSLTLKNIKESKPTHKLGALYILDSIARQYRTKADELGESITTNAADGTFAGGLVKFGKILKEAVDETINNVSGDQKEKIEKLLTIWTKANTFDKTLINELETKYFGKPQTSQSPNSNDQQLNTPLDPSDILKNLASLVQSGQSSQPPQPPQPPQQSAVVPPTQATTNAPLDPQAAMLAMLQNLQQSGQLPPMPQPPVPQYQQEHSDQSDPRNRFQNNSSVSQEEAFKSFRNGGSRDQGGQGNYRERSNNGFSRRNRSRSPNRDDRGNNTSRSHPPPGHVVGERNVPGTPHYRVKEFSIDPTLPAGSIKVLSRTVFIGGVPGHMSETDLATVLRPFAEVQSVILNSERKHAFVKVYSRKEAEEVISSFNKSGSHLGLRTRWGVGFGPRDCCDYQHGVSIIPIARLTDADRRWVTLAEWGGIGDSNELAPGYVMEEPDIEIGEGVSSKAISKKMPTDGSRNGPRSTKPGEPDDMFTDPLNKAQVPSFMQQASAKSNVLAGLFGGAPPAPPVSQVQQQVPAPPAGASNAQLESLMALLQQQKK